ncbi:hypothetical protein [Mycobacteroides abscessus]
MMSDEFVDNVQRIIGPLLTNLGFELDGIDENVDEGGRSGIAIYYKSKDCKLQVYWSSREGEINCMIGPIWAANEHGLYDKTGEWHYLNDFTKPPDLPLEDLVAILRAERENFKTETGWLEWLRNRISQYFDAAHAGVLAMHPNRPGS